MRIPQWLLSLSVLDCKVLSLVDIPAICLTLIFNKPHTLQPQSKSSFKNHLLLLSEFLPDSLKLEVCLQHHVWWVEQSSVLWLCAPVVLNFKEFAEQTLCVAHQDLGFPPGHWGQWQGSSCPFRRMSISSVQVVLQPACSFTSTCCWMVHWDLDFPQGTEEMNERGNPYLSVNGNGESSR